MNNNLFRSLHLEVFDNALARSIGASQEPASVIEPSPAEHGGTDSHTAGPFDQDALMDRLMGDHDLAKQVARLFVDQMPQDLMALASAIDDSDPPAIAFAAHRIKGAAANIGGTAVQEIAAKLEDLGNTGNLEAASAAMVELEATFQSLKPVIEQFCDGNTASCE